MSEKTTPERQDVSVPITAPKPERQDVSVPITAPKPAGGSVL
tara:strand:- start:274 stop:399 length:126 start_codon:yes stop_codon:yes gene_type:complete